MLLGLLAYPLIRRRGRRRTPEGGTWSVVHGAEAPADRSVGPAMWTLLRGGPVLLQIGDRRVLTANGQVVRIEGRQDVKVAAALEEQVVWLLAADASVATGRRRKTWVALPWRRSRRGGAAANPPARPRVDRTA